MPEIISAKPASVKSTPATVGAQLKARRLALRLSLSQIELSTKIRGKFLTALETGNYSTLDNDVYSRGFVQHYANHLGLDGTEVAAAYALERGGILAGKTQRPQLERPKRLVFTGPLMAALGSILLVGAILAYLLWQFSALAAPPQLTITSPDGDQALTGSVIDVGGRTTPGADISVNDSLVFTDTDGAFSEKVALQDGVNAIRIVSRSKLGKTTIITRNVLARLPKVDKTQATVPMALFDGVAVAVSVKDLATSVIVMVDGKEAWKGTVMPGWSKLFQGAKDINITTGNAGVTSVMLTNTVSLNKKISPLGREGEIRRNQDFAKDTVIP